VFLIKKIIITLAAVFCGFFLFPLTSFAARLDTHSGIVKTNASNQMAYSNQNLGSPLGQYICAGDWYNIVQVCSNSTRYVTYPITVHNGKGTITETHYFNGVNFINNADGSTGNFSYSFNQNQWYNYLPSSITYTDFSDNGATDNYGQIYVSNNRGFFIQPDSYNKSKLICYDGQAVMRADYVSHFCYYNNSDYYDCDWHWARAGQGWSAVGLNQGVNTVYFAGTDASANYTTDQAQFLYDTVAPYASNVSISNITDVGYDVYVYGVGDATSGVSTVRFPTWTKSDQSDIKWDVGTNLGDGIWYYHVNKSNWSNAVNNYSTHVYVYDNAGNVAFAGGYGGISLITTNLQIGYLPPNSNYRANTDVVTSYRVSNIGDTDILPSSNLAVSFSAYYLNGSTPVYIANTSKNSIIIPANNNNLVYFKWRVPDIAGKTVYISATVNSTNTIIEINTNDNTSNFQAIVDTPTNSQTLDTQFETKAPTSFTRSSPILVTGSASWIEWTYTNGYFSRIYYGIQLNAYPIATPDNSVLSNKYQNGYWYMRSGYGFSINVPFSVSSVSGYTMPASIAYSSAQRAQAMFSENMYSGDVLGKFCDLQIVSNSFQFSINSNAKNNRYHFIPIWMPDGDYIAKTRLYDLWTPAGMIDGYYLTPPLKISGSVYDDYYATGN
jgi:hypothetical protein